MGGGGGRVVSGRRRAFKISCTIEMLENGGCSHRRNVKERGDGGGGDLHGRGEALLRGGG